MKKINKLIYWAYAGLIFFVPLVFTIWNFELFEFNKIVLVYFFTTIILFAWITKMILFNKFIFRHTFWDIPLILFLASQIISTIFSIDPLTSIFGYYSRFNGGLLSTFCYTILFWGLVSNLDKSQANKLIKTGLISGLIVSFYGIGQRLGIDKHLWVQDVQSRIFSTLGQPNWLAAYLNILIFLALGQKSTIYYLLFTIYYITLLFTGSRSGFLGFIIPFTIWTGINVGTILRLSLPKKARRLKKIGIIISITIILSITIGIPFSLKDRFDISFLSDVPQSQFVAPDPVTDLHITPSSDIRRIVWQGAVDLWKQNPIIGTGVETFGYSYYWTRPVEHNLTSEWDFLYNKAHNEFLNLAATTGSLGLITYLILIASAIFFSIKKSLYSLFYVLISILITNFFGFSVVATSLFFFLLPGIAFLQTTTITKNRHHSTPHNRLTGILLFLIGIIALFSTFLIVRYWLGDFYYAKGKKYADAGFLNSANSYFDKAIKFNPLEPNYYSERGILYAKLTAYYTQENSRQMAEKHLQPAIDNSSLAIQISPYHLNFYKNKVRAYYYLAIYDLNLLNEAIKILKKAENLAPTDPKIPFNLGQIYQTLDNNQKAEEYYQKAIHLKPNYEKAEVAIENL